MPKNYGICYEITSNNEVKGYVFGTVHMFTKDKKISKNILNGFKNSNCLVLEADILKVTKELKNQPIDLNNYNKGKVIAEYLNTEEDNSHYKELLKPLGIKRFLLSKVLSLELIKASYPLLKLKKLGLESRYSLDLFFAELGKKYGKETLYLEYIEEQKKLIEPMDEAGINIMLELNDKEFLEHSNKLVKSMERLVNSYKENDLEDLKNMLSDEDGTLDEYTKETIINKRNLQMALKIDQYIRYNKKPFACVGLAHLLTGKNNIVDVLTEKGYKLNIVN